MKKKSEKVRGKILDAAVNLMSMEGYKNVSMRKIAKQAKVGDATIYNYFPNKESLLYGYFAALVQKSVEELQAIDDFEGYSLQEKIQLLIETNLTQMLPHREFVQEAFEITFLTPLAKFGNIAPIKSQLSDQVRLYLSQAYQQGTLEEESLHEFIPSLFWDYYLGMVMYWLKDDSEDFTNTTQLLDLSLNFAISLLASGVLSKAGQMTSFLIRQHMFSGFELMAKQFSQLRGLTGKGQRHE
ncbi:TetR/AcrR family transcriptional regulator [Photobacterium atrarenae]|uniref:TetR/AcrR family transcriptional regulator n=1 Tax=Photobacterium atrarenae TaxID=865757 RepID=A0ABY5GK39_9GAMM|nr:TetR family transcriptional regulator [Photobacterium atrarenae]UTV29597.1 TetR/AcrR family transcriptional regulator [Photobacterium atrarenae]